MGLNRRSFLRALIGVPFAAKAIEGIIARGISAPPPAIEPVKPLAEPEKWTVPVAADEGRTYGFSGTPISLYHGGLLRFREEGLTPLQPNDPVRVNSEGRLEKCDAEATDIIGHVVQTVTDIRFEGDSTKVDVRLRGYHDLSHLRYKHWETSWERPW